MRLDKNSLVKEAAPDLDAEQFSRRFLRTPAKLQHIPPADRYPVSISYPSGKRNFRMENANGRDNESPSILIACAHNEAVTRSLSRSWEREREKRWERKRGRERRSRHKLLSHLHLRDLSLRPMVEHLRLRRTSFSPAFPWLAGFHRASSFVSLEYVGIRFIYFPFFSPRSFDSSISFRS